MRLLARRLSLFAPLLALIGFVSACSAADGPAKYEEGKQYKEVREEQTPADPKRIEVAEFFWYGCPHCYDFDPTISAWEKTKPGDVDFVRVPHTLGRPIGQLHAKAFYTAQALNVFEQMHPALFDAIQKQHQPLANDAQIAQLFNRVTGVLPDVFASTFNGFTVDSRARKAEQLTRDLGVLSVPTIVVGGKYMTSAAMAGSFDETTKVIDFLVDKVRKERAGK